ncbi:hypothetical protein BZG36_02110 [Bifiguratus adelaidae]|uniref:Succinate-semialdehyde dehydrogenase n=1 Tax=Bifiguratus adelaidae TaxID=1938954 RepID=A0A261Y303_9FUNG|nr:hypothetical protein BZG36_02110 [Bifiguratus adelaidae]
MAALGYLRTPYIVRCLSRHSRQVVRPVVLKTWQVQGMATHASVDDIKLKDPSLFKQEAFVNDKWTSGSAQERFDVYDPATGKVIGTCPDMSAQDTRNAIEVAEKAFHSWATQSAKSRHDIMKKWYDLMMENQEDLGKILTWENGKTFTEAKGEIAYGASFIEWFAEEAVRTYGDIIPSPTPGNRFLTIKQPVGVCGIITPWNFPNAMITRKVGAALAAGCTVVVKPGSETPFSALAIAELGLRAGIPPGVLNVVTSHKHMKDVGEELTTNPLVKKISFTGSTPVGKLLMRQSSSTLKKMSLELGGNAPFIIFDDADVDSAVEGAIMSKFRGTGQTCVCANRIYVQKGIYDEFASKVAAKVEKFKAGNGFDPATTHGPLIHEKAVEKVQRHVDDAVKQGAQVLAGGKHLGGNFYQPTVLGGMTGDMILSSEETFGPVAGLFPFSTEDEVIQLANNTPFGLAAYFYSRDIGRCFRVAERLDTGMVGVNSPMVSSPYAPFGGVKESGMGREGSKYGIQDYMNVKFINLGNLQ